RAARGEGGVGWARGARDAGSFASLDAAAITRAPMRRAISTAAEPTPPAAPRTTTWSPGRTSATLRSASYAVAYTTGNAAAAARSTPSGTRTSPAAGATAASANAPTKTVPHTRSPARTPLVAAPTAATVPAKSLPGVNGVGTDAW